MPYRILCLSHLGWDPTLFQRPHQLMIRLARRGHAVTYAGCVGLGESLRKASLRSSSDWPAALQVLHLPVAPTARRASRLRRAYSRYRLQNTIPVGDQFPTLIWLYHPALLSLGQSLYPDAPIVYDAMDRFAAFSASGPDVGREEKNVLAAAAVVFTGGRSIDQSVRLNLPAAGKNANLIHCLPSGVDLDHFGQALLNELAVPHDLRPLPRPILGYFGAIDERIDYELLRHVAGANQLGSVVLVGPVVGAPPPPLPPNVHLLGARPYRDLPSYVKGFDVCLLPFRATALVAHVSPTKTPEYLAGGRPVVSTPIPDVMAEYEGVVQTAATADEFTQACRRLAASPPDPAYLHSEARARARTWDQITEEMERVIREALV